MIVLPLDEADRQAVLNFLLPDLVRNGGLIADCTVLRDRARVFVAMKGDRVLGVISVFDDFAGVRCTSLNVFRKLVAAFGGLLAGHTVWSIVGAEELAYIESLAEIEWIEPVREMLYDSIAGPVSPRAPEGVARTLTITDLGLMREFYQAIETEHWTPTTLALGPAYGIVEDDRLVAAAGSYYVTDWLGEVGMVGVLPRYRRRGYAMLVSHLVTRDLLARAKKVCLHVVRSNAAAHRLYLQMGYRDVGEAFLLPWHV